MKSDAGASSGKNLATVARSLDFMAIPMGSHWRAYSHLDDDFTHVPKGKGGGGITENMTIWSCADYVRFVREQLS